MSELPERMPRPEREAKPLTFMLLGDDEKAEFYALTDPQKGYFLHWVRSNPRWSQGGWSRAIRKAREQRP